MPSYAVSLRRSALAAALHADAEHGAVASGLDRGLSAYCWPRDALWVGGAMERLGHPEIGKGVLQWLNKVRLTHHPFLYWFQKYSIDGVPEWETPAVDQTAMIPWSLEQLLPAALAISISSPASGRWSSRRRGSARAIRAAIPDLPWTNH